ncbi:hypothetical protein WN51_13139 [Melipona quadrifasciata]|uniref:Uncharacterized protein n=1 Tax=Melipona quadrifasciata TaxID=166423 RepID=A0A0N0BGF4_9HYME|nr:hypothetical protein WN51_13139 [Melipona quadrifasciata]
MVAIGRAPDYRTVLVRLGAECFSNATILLKRMIAYDTHSDSGLCVPAARNLFWLIPLKFIEYRSNECTYMSIVRGLYCARCCLNMFTSVSTQMEKKKKKTPQIVTESADGRSSRID